jgi:hypothetical protein
MTINGSADPVKTGNQILRAFAALHSDRGRLVSMRILSLDYKIIRKRICSNRK